MPVHLLDKLWAIKMFWLWCWRLGYWDVDALKAAWGVRKHAEERREIVK